MIALFDMSSSTIWNAGILILGAGLTYAAMLKVNSKSGPLQAAAMKDLTEVYRLQISAHKDNLEMQKGHFDVEIEEMKSERDKFRAERDTYRERLHTEKNNHQATTLAMVELQARPNVDQVYSSLERNFAKNTQTLEQIRDTISQVGISLEKHDNGIEERMKQFAEPLIMACDKMSALIEKQS